MMRAAPGLLVLPVSPKARRLPSRKPGGLFCLQNSEFIMSHPSKPIDQADLVYGLEDRPPFGNALLSAITHLLAIFVPMITGLGFAFHGGSAKRNALKGLASQLYRQAMVPVHNAIFQNPDDRALFVKKGLVPMKKTRIVNGSGVNLTQFARVPLPPGPEVTFLLAARLLKAKGIREYVEAATQVKQKYPNARFIIIGYKDSSPDAIPESMIESWATSDVISYEGGVKDVRPFVTRASVCVLPSYSEGLPRTVLEALAMGRPVITTDVPGCRETVTQDVNGCLIPARNVPALVAAMERYLTEPGLMERHGEASYQLALEKFDVRKVNVDILAATE